MTGTQSSRSLARWRLARIAALLLGLTVGVTAAGPAHAEKVGVAAAVNPDAFSSLSGTPNQQLSIGKNIFFSERINTTASGLVQVLLLDGSTFTVGPNSDLVIDKFVYDPRKKTGEMVATFSKGTMRFIGGKLSKNAGGVTVKTPNGALAIRGGMFQGSTSRGIYSFLYGVQMSFRSNSGQTHTVFENGYTLDLSGGTPRIRPTTPEDTNFFMTSLSPSNTGGTTGGTGPTGTGGTQQASFFSDSLDEIINEATATQIQDQIDKQIQQLTQKTTSPDKPSDTDTETPDPVQTASFGYASGIYINDHGPWYKNAGTLTNLRPTEVGLLFTDNVFDGAQFDLYADARSWYGDGGTKITFAPIDVGVIPGAGEILPETGLFFGFANAELAANSIQIFHDTENFPRELANPAIVNSGNALLVGVTGEGEFLCESCDHLMWGAWLGAANYESDERTLTNENAKVPEHAVANGIRETEPVSVSAFGWWVAADDLPTVGQLPLQGTATYSGKTIGNVAIYTGDGWKDYIATGKVHMKWDFADRSGILKIRNFRDAGKELPSLNAWGRMTSPGVLEDTNRFSGKLFGKLGRGPSGPTVSGSAVGSFAANNGNNAASVIGNWNVGNATYKASGVFGASQKRFNPDGFLPNLSAAR